jgi:hypothetical protein
MDAFTTPAASNASIVPPNSATSLVIMIPSVPVYAGILVLSIQLTVYHGAAFSC